MTPREFLDQVVRPNVADLEANFGSLRHAYNAVASVDALVDHFYPWLVANRPGATSASDDSAHRQELAGANRDFGLRHQPHPTKEHTQ